MTGFFWVHSQGRRQIERMPFDGAVTDVLATVHTDEWLNGIGWDHTEVTGRRVSTAPRGISGRSRHRKVRFET